MTSNTPQPWEQGVDATPGVSGANGVATATRRLGQGVAAMRNVSSLAPGAIFAVAGSANLQTWVMAVTCSWTTLRSLGGSRFCRQP